MSAGLPGSAAGAATEVGSRRRRWIPGNSQAAVAGAVATSPTQQMANFADMATNFLLAAAPASVTSTTAEVAPLGKSTLPWTKSELTKDSPDDVVEASRGDGAPRLFAVCRHAERADASWGPAWAAWQAMGDAKRFPHDPPLSDHGKQEAARMGERLREIAAECGDEFHGVVTSPYLRCVETALAIVAALGPSARLVVDESLGEVFGPEIFGSAEHGVPTSRGVAAVRALCAARGVECEELLHGERPKWPESSQAARARIAHAFVECLRGKSGPEEAIAANQGHRENFILVTHSDGVKASLGLMPTEAKRSVENVAHGGMFWASRMLKDGMDGDTFDWNVDMSGIERSLAMDSPEAVMRRRFRQLSDKSPGLQLHAIAKLLSCCHLFAEPALPPPAVAKAIASEVTTPAQRATTKASLELGGILLKSPTCALIARRRLRDLEACAAR